MNYRNHWKIIDKFPRFIIGPKEERRKKNIYLLKYFVFVDKYLVFIRLIIIFAENYRSSTPYISVKYGVLLPKSAILITN